MCSQCRLVRKTDNSPTPKQSAGSDWKRGRIRKCPKWPRCWEKDLLGGGRNKLAYLDDLAREGKRRLADAELRLAEGGCSALPPPSDERAVPFLRVIGALREWTGEQISDQDFARCLRKAAREAQLGL